MSLQQAVQDAQASNKTESTSGKNPAYYAKRKQSFIDETCQSPVTEVRIHAAGSEFTPSSNLKLMLDAELDKDVLSALLMNDRVPIKALEAFIATDACSRFAEGDEAYDHVVGRLNLATSDPGSSDNPDGDGDSGDSEE